MEESEKPTFVINHPSFLGLQNFEDESDEERIKSYLKPKTCPTIRSFYVHGELENRLGFDICSFVSGKIKDIDEQDSIIFDLEDKSHESKIILVHYNKRIYSYLVSKEEDSKKIRHEMLTKLEKYKCV